MFAVPIQLRFKSDGEFKINRCSFVGKMNYSCCEYHIVIAVIVI